VQCDERGRFVKTFHRELFAESGLETVFAEEYYSVSLPGVLRGLHFQLPPHQHVKTVYCVTGRVLDVVLDLRIGSPSYRQCAAFDLAAEKGNLIYVPEGCAHGFYVPRDSTPATMIYNVSSVYAPEFDSGIRWDSVSFDWPDPQPTLSDRDRGFPALDDFQMPFQWKQKP
jgi:dTDP-4-dehydrorhamnose 3,5-epimerase